VNEKPASDQSATTVPLAQAFDLAWERYYMAGEEETISKKVRRRELAGFLVELFEEWSHGRRGPSRTQSASLNRIVAWVGGNR
jgi:hypothetical protein